MTPAFLKYYFLVISGIMITTELCCQEIFQPNSCHNILFLNESRLDELPSEFYLFKPVYKNLVQTQKVQPITYSIEKVYSKEFFKELQPGTYLCSFEPLIEDTASSINIYTEYTIIQLIYKKSEGYIGHLEELLNVPFVLPPRQIKLGHQTDLRLGVDCAELAIYGKRQQGFNIPYCGPKGILDYLIPTSTLEPGTVISFGNNFQISVLYEDRGIIGVLDDEDLLIHAYKDKAEIVTLKESGLKGYPYSLYRWKE